MKKRMGRTPTSCLYDPVICFILDLSKGRLLDGLFLWRFELVFSTLPINLLGMRSAITLLLVLFSLIIEAQDLRAYQLYNSKGKAVKFGKAAKNIAKAQVVLFGELHNNPVDHWLQFELSTYLLRQEGELVFGAEMLEADNADAYHKYLEGEIDGKALDTLARLWPNFDTDYLHLLDLAKNNSCQFVATNVPRRYARMVYRKGLESLDTLSELEKSWMSPLPIQYNPELPSYLAMLEMAGGHGGENLPKAQAIKDATMAHFIYKALPSKGIFIHFNGDYHSANFEGIYWYLKQKDPDLQIVTISTVLQEDVDKLQEEYKGRADYILVIDENMTTSY